MYTLLQLPGCRNPIRTSLGSPYLGSTSTLWHGGLSPVSNVTAVLTTSNKPLLTQSGRGHEVLFQNVLVLLVLFLLLKRLNVLPPQGCRTFSTRDVADQMLTRGHLLLHHFMLLDVDHLFEQVGRSHGPFEALGHEIVVGGQMLAALFASVHLAVQVLCVSEAHVGFRSCWWVLWFLSECRGWPVRVTAPYDLRAQSHCSYKLRLPSVISNE